MDDDSFTPATEHGPRRKSWRGYAKALQQSGDLARAIRAWRRAGTEPADTILAHKRLSSLLSHLGRAAEAAPHLRAVIAAEPLDPGLRRELAHCLQQSGQTREEAEAWRKLLELEPGDEEALRRLAVLQPPGRAEALGSGLEGLELGARLQSLGDFAGAADVYRPMWPLMRQALRQFRPDGRAAHGPDILIIGASRTGTSWLVRTLARHPQIFFLAGEPHYFNAWAEQPPQAYVGRFAAADAVFVSKPESAWPLVKGQALFGDKSPLYLTMPDDRIALCATMFPKARVICMVRDPIERAWSHLKQLGIQDQAEDLAFLKSGQAPARLGQILEEGRYEQHLRRWAREVSPDRILLIDHARIPADPEGIYEETIAWLGLEPRKPRKAQPPPVKISTTEPPPKALLDYLEASYAGLPFDIPSLQRALIKAHKAARTGVAEA